MIWKRTCTSALTAVFPLPLLMMTLSFCLTIALFVVCR